MLYNPRNYQKSINKSIRLSQPVYDYIMQAPGDGFNQKFENIIIDAKESEARRQKTLKMLLEVIPSSIFLTLLVLYRYPFLTGSPIYLVRS